ncbi:MAG: exosome complex exonuclease Rrp41 [Methanobacteriota archaeon]|nr:MAG: exosome complex exonuclease Rrp41 [Euryarchaeota archaeon]
MRLSRCWRVIDVDVELFKDGKRLDGRDVEDLRKPLKLEVGVLQKANGSAYMEWGKNKILAGVFGPKEAIPKHLANPERGVIRCIYTMSTFAGLEDHGRMGPNRRSIEISKVMREALENVVMLEKFPSTIIEVYVIVLQSEGGTRVSSLTAAAAALMDAGIPMKEPIAAVAAGKAGGKVILDLNKDEDNYGEADVPMAFTKSGDIVLFQMDGKLSKEELETAIDYGWKGTEKLFELQRKAFEEEYSEPLDKKLRMVE